jgi:hypothetical protein
MHIDIDLYLNMCIDINKYLNIFLIIMSISCAET